jgi:hypothetical protein
MLSTALFLELELRLYLRMRFLLGDFSHYTWFSSHQLLKSNLCKDMTHRWSTVKTVINLKLSVANERIFLKNFNLLQQPWVCCGALG